MKPWRREYCSKDRWRSGTEEQKIRSGKTEKDEVELVELEVQTVDSVLINYQPINPLRYFFSSAFSRITGIGIEMKS